MSTPCEIRFPYYDLYSSTYGGANNPSNYKFGNNALQKSLNTFNNLPSTSVLTQTKNQAFGGNAGVAQSTSNNIAIGYNALPASLNSGTSNIAIGARAGSGLTSGSKNIIIGTDAAVATTSGNYNVCIGYNAKIASGLTQCIVIGANANCVSDNTIVLGGPSNNSLICYGIQSEAALTGAGLLTPGTWYYTAEGTVGTVRVKA